MVCSPHFRKFLNMVGTCSLREEDSMHFSFLDIRENPENEPFLRPKKCFWVVFFCFPAQNLYWQVRFAKKRTRFGQSGPLEHRL